MTVSNEMLAILAMDAYNQGYDPGVSGLGTQIGNSALVPFQTPTAWVPAGFYAAAYRLASGEIVISYRGTDVMALDMPNGYPLGSGNPLAPQARMAIEFYLAVKALSATEQNPYPTIILTGHSLGGGLAGFVAGLYGLNATLFDPMPFTDGVNITYDFRVAGIPGDLPSEIIAGYISIRHFPCTSPMQQCPAVSRPSRLPHHLAS